MEAGRFRPIETMRRFRHEASTHREGHFTN